MKAWLDKFLLSRDVTKPDNRPLFQYRVSEDEYNYLISSLLLQQPGIQHNSYTDRLFVLYASEWWRRNYSGGAWAWKSITDPLKWRNLSHPKLAEMVRAGLKYWNRPLLTYQSETTAFLLSIIIEGGLPVNILETSGNNLTRYLKALLNDFSTFRGSGISTLKLAEDLGRYLPKGFRRSGVYQLSADLISCIDDLASDLDLKKDPFKQLEANKPGWQDNLPFVLESDSAKHMINGLLQQAKRSQSGDRGQIRLRRKLINKDGIWVFSATLLLPASISVQQIAKSLNLHESVLPSRAELTLESSGQLRKVAQLVRTDEDFNVYAYDKNSLELSVHSSEQITCSLTSLSNYIGQVSLDGGEPINPELPILFSAIEGKDDELEVIGQGGLSTRRPSVYIAIPNDCEIVSIEGETEDVSGSIHNASLIKLEGSMKVGLSDGLTCLIKTTQEKDSGNQCRILGSRLYSLEVSNTRIFSGIPQFVVLTESGLHKNVSLDDVIWRPVKGASGWNTVKSQIPLGLIDLRVLQEGSCILFDKIICLPAEFQYLLHGGGDPTIGEIQLLGLDDVSIGSVDNRVKLDESDSSGSKINVICESQELDRKRVPLIVRWNSGEECQLLLPYPSTGAMFSKSDDLAMVSGIIPIGSLIHITASGISQHPGAHYELVGTLVADDITTAVSRNLSFGAFLDTQGDGYHELPLLRLYNQISELFSYSADLDARITLEIISDGQRCTHIDIVQFEGELKFDTEENSISFTSYLEANEEEHDSISHNIHLMPFCEEEDGVSVEKLNEELDLDVWKVNLPDKHMLPSMATLTESMRSVRPCLVFSPVDQMEGGENGSLFKTAWDEARPGSRAMLLDQALDSLLVEDKEWQFLEQHIKNLQDAHPDCLDTYNHLIEYPELLTSAFIRLGSNFIGMFEDWQDYLPFKWWQVPISAWKQAILNFQKSLDDAEVDEEIQNIVLQQKWDDLAVFNQRIPFLLPVINTLGYELFGMQKSKMAVMVEQNLKAVYAHLYQKLTLELIRAKAESTWPNGPGREWWEGKITKSGYQGDVAWMDDHGSKYRKPFLDALVAVCTVVASGGYLDREARVIVSAARAFSPEYFDQMYAVAVPLYYSLVEK